MGSQEKTLYYYLSKYRSELMGIAILWVVWYHSELEPRVFSIEAINIILRFIKKTGYGGVDIFLLLSGMGLYNSLSHNTISGYLENRLKRILPTWWILYLITAILETRLLDIHYSAKELLGGITLTGFLTQLPNQGNWYVSFIMVIYLIAPIFYSLFHENKNKSMTCVVLMVLTLFMSVVFWGDDGRLTGMSRLPIFVLGMYISSERDKIKVNYKTIIALSGILIIGVALLGKCLSYDWDTRWHYGLWWYPFILITPGLALLLVLLLEKTSKACKHLQTIPRSCGEASLELLIISEFVVIHSVELIEFTIPHGLFVFLSIIVSAVLAVAFHYAIEKAIAIRAKDRSAAMN